MKVTLSMSHALLQAMTIRKHKVNANMRLPLWESQPLLCALTMKFSLPNARLQMADCFGIPRQQPSDGNGAASIIALAFVEKLILELPLQLRKLLLRLRKLRLRLRKL